MNSLSRVFAVATSALLLAGAAHAVTFSAAPGAPDPGPGAGESILVDFNGALPAGYTLTGSFQYKFGSSKNNFAAPAGDKTRYLLVSSANGTGEATLMTEDLASVSFYWGSIDDYNDVDILGAGGVTLLTLNGANIPPANGDQSDQFTNRRVFFEAEGSEIITGLRFRSTGIAFEIDDVAGSFDDGNPLPTIPEPASWALMIAGFGFVGIAARRRRGAARVAA